MKFTDIQQELQDFQNSSNTRFFGGNLLLLEIELVPKLDAIARFATPYYQAELLGSDVLNFEYQVRVNEAKIWLNPDKEFETCLEAKNVLLHEMIHQANYNYTMTGKVLEFENLLRKEHYHLNSDWIGEIDKILKTSEVRMQIYNNEFNLPLTQLINSSASSGHELKNIEIEIEGILLSRDDSIKFLETFPNSLKWYISSDKFANLW